MSLPFRRKPLALLICYGFTGSLAGLFALNAHAQAAGGGVLRVDPVLLGLPPLKPAEVPIAVPVPAVEKAKAEVRVVEPAAVEVVEPTPAAPVKPLATPAVQASPQKIPARSAAPAAAPEVATPVRPSAPAETAAPVTALPVRTQREEAALEAPATAVPRALPAPVAPVATASPVAASLTKPTTGTSSSVAALRVDPALLGAPPVMAGGAPAASTQRPATGATARAAGSAAPIQVASAGQAAGMPSATVAGSKNWLQRLWAPVDNAYSNGTLELYLPFHAHHLRSKYDADKIASFQEKPPGLGLGRGLYNEKGNWEGVYAMGFQDSHFKPMWMAGYGWKTFWRPVEDVRLGLGYTAFLMTRADIGSYIPFPGILPLASVAYKNLNLETAFVPGSKGNGNIFFIWAKWELGKTGEAIGTPARPAPPAVTELAAASPLMMPAGSAGVAPYVPGAAMAAGADGSSAGAGSGFAQPPQLSASGPRDEEAVPSDLTPALSLRSSSKMLPLPAKSDVPRPVFISAQNMSGTAEREAVAEGAAELRKIGTVVNADRMTYWPLDDELEAAGNVRLAQGDDLVSGPKMRLKLEDQVGFFEQPSYFIRRESTVVPDAHASSVSSVPLRKTTEGRGQAERIDFEGVNQIRLRDATYTTCKPGNDDWYAKAGDLKLDYDREVADGSDAAVYFKGVPILYSPWMSFSLNNNRKSGLLSPTFGSTSNSGLELTLPYYWNIAPNMDATIAPRALTKRGMQVSSEFRYLGETYAGEARAEILQNDKLANRDRYAYSLQHAQNLGYGFAGSINYNKVSDDTYFTDLSSRITNTSQTQLLQQGLLSYTGGGWWSATANVQGYQTLQPDPKNLVAEPYRLMPQLTINARQPDLYRTDSSFFGQFTSFSHPTQIEARRTVLYPQIALPYETPGWYVTPKIGVHSTTYSLNRQAIGTPDSLTRTLPVFSLDSGMTFERPSNWFGRDYTQTLEPRLFYLNIPYKDQSNIPLFDSGLADFNFAQIFSENQFVGQDRVNDANQLTAAVTSRLINPASGSEVMRAMIGQRYYFRNQQVTLDNLGISKRVWDRSNFLAAFSGQVLPKVYADAATEYNTIHGSMERMSLGGRYVPEPGKVLNVTYRFNSNAAAPIKQVDVSAQWPIYGAWHAVGRANYSLQDKAPIENIAGLEYNGGCWVMRFVGQRLATTTGTASSALFIQLELNDFSQIGSNPLDLLKRSIQGYGRVNQPTADPVFGQ